MGVMTSGLAHLTSRALIQVEGPDWRSFLQGLITQDVVDLAEGVLAYGALLTPQGRLLHDLFVWGEDAGGFIDVSADARESLIAKLTLYRLRAKVQIRSHPGLIMAAWGSEPPADGVWRRDPRLPDFGWRAIFAVEQDGSSEDAYHQHRLSLGAPDPRSDASENDYPIELNLDLLQGIDFHKGCFVGQETTSRMHRRGVVKSRLAPIVFTGPAPAFGAAILAGERRAGEVRSGREGRALALVRVDRVTHAELTVNGRPVRLDLPAWLQPPFSLAVQEARSDETTG